MCEVESKKAALSNVTTMEFVKMSTMCPLFQVNLMPRISSNKCSPAVR